MSTSKGKIRIFTVIFFIVIFGIMLLPLIASAGSLEPSAAPAPTMKTLDEIYNKLDILGTRTRFQVTNDEAVMDYKTGLEWERSTNATRRTWDEASTYCTNLLFGGYIDWRLPTVNELFGLADTTQSNPSLPLLNPFINVYTSKYWTSTVANTTDPGYFWYISFDHGSGDYLYRNNLLYVRCVRG